MTVTSFTVSQGATTVRPENNIEEFLIKYVLPELLGSDIKNPVLLADDIKFCLVLRNFVKTPPT